MWADEITKLLRAERLERRNGETPMRFARRVDAAGIFSESVTPAGECLSTIRYSGREPGESDTGIMRDTAMLLRGELSGKGRLRYWNRRMFRRGKAIVKRSGHKV